MREKNPPQQNHSKQKQEKQAKNSPKPQQQQQQQQQQQNQPKQKLISKTQFVLGSPLKSTPQTNVNSNVAATVTNPIQILSRQQSQPQQIIQQSPKQSQPPQQQQQQQQQPSTPNSKKLNQTTAVATSVQSQNLLGESLYHLIVLIKLFYNNFSAFNYLLIKLFEKNIYIDFI